jgi:hypothetical protein
MGKACGVIEKNGGNILCHINMKIGYGKALS